MTDGVDRLGVAAAIRSAPVINHGGDMGPEDEDKTNDDEWEEEEEEIPPERPEYDSDGNEISYDENGRGYVEDNDGERHDPNP